MRDLVRNIPVDFLQYLEKKNRVENCHSWDCIEGIGLGRHMERQIIVGANNIRSQTLARRKCYR